MYHPTTAEILMHLLIKKGYITKEELEDSRREIVMLKKIEYLQQKLKHE